MKIMKNKILILTIVCLGIFGLKSCTDDDNFRFQTPESVQSIVITNSLLGEYILTVESFTNVAERFTWESPDFGVQTNVNYDIEYSADGSFESPEVVTSTSENQASLTIEQLWNLASNNLGLEPNTDNDAGELYFRVKADIGANEAENSPETFSEVQVVFVRLVESDGGGEVALRDLFLVGDATMPGWDNNNNNPPIVRDPENPNFYTFTGKFGGDPAAFKLLENRGQWQPQWGLSEGALASSDDLGADPDVFNVPGAEGYYTITVDIDNASFDIVSFDDSASPTYGTIGIIGSATTGGDDGWGQDIDLTQSSFDPHLWYINGLELFDGESKFRAEDDWSTNWGSNTALTGYGSFDGPNIPVAAGIYDVWFNDIDGTYVFIPLGEE